MKFYSISWVRKFVENKLFELPCKSVKTFLPPLMRRVKSCNGRFLVIINLISFKDLVLLLWIVMQAIEKWKETIFYFTVTNTSRKTSILSLCMQHPLTICYSMPHFLRKSQRVEEEFLNSFLTMTSNHFLLTLW